MFTKFNRKYIPDQQVFFKTFKNDAEFLRNFSSISFNNGIYRIINGSMQSRWNSFISDYFAAYTGVQVFASDWHGRIFASDKEKHNRIFIFDISFDEVLEIPVSFSDFHNIEMVDFEEDLLCKNFYQSWLEYSINTIPSLDECIAYKTPPCLGGIDSVNNLELINMDVYWTICGQILLQTRGLPDGTHIGKIHVDDNL